MPTEKYNPSAMPQTEFERVQIMIARRTEVITYLDPTQLLRPENVAQMLAEEDTVRKVTAANLQRLFIPYAATFHAMLDDALLHQEDLISIRLHPKKNHLLFSTQGSTDDYLTFIAMTYQEVKRRGIKEKIPETVAFYEAGRENLRRIIETKQVPKFGDPNHDLGLELSLSYVPFPLRYLTGFTMDHDGRIKDLASLSFKSNVGGQIVDATRYGFEKDDFRAIDVRLYRGDDGYFKFRTQEYATFILMSDGCLHRSINGHRSPLTVEQEIEQILADLPLKEELPILDREFPVLLPVTLE